MLVAESLVNGRCRQWTAALVLLLAAPVASAAQGCPNPLPPTAKGGNHFLVGAETLAPLASGLLVSGQAMYFIERSTDPPQVDSTVGAFLLRGSERPVRIRRPFAEQVFAPRLASLAADSAIITFGRPLLGADGLAASDSIGLWVATIRGNQFVNPRLVARVSQGPGLATEITGNLVRVGDEVVQAIAMSWPQLRGWMGVALLRFSADSVAVEFADLGVSQITSVDFAVHGGRWFLAVVATSRHDDGKAGLWYSEKTERGWSPATNVVPVGPRWINEPRLLSTSEGLVLAHSELGEVGETEIDLRWRGIAGARDTVMHSMPAHWPTFRAESPFQSLLSVVTGARRAQVLQLLPSGYIEVATLPVGVPRAPIVGGSLERPVAVGLIRSDMDSTQVQVATFDLRCGLGAMRPPRR